MASNIVLKTYAAGDNNQGSVTPQNDALIYQAAIPTNGLFFGGTVTLSSANVLHVAAGMGIIGGRFFEVLESEIAVQLSASGDLLGRLYIHLDLSNADNPIEIKSYTGASLPALSGDPNLNISGGSFDMELCTFDINELTISNIVNKFPTITAANNQIRRATAYSVNDFALCQSADDSLLFICTTAGTTAVSEPTGYKTITDNNTITDGTAVFKAISITSEINRTRALLAPIQLDLTAGQAYSVGSQFVYNGLLYKVTSAISNGGTITIGGNCTLADNVTNQILQLTAEFNKHCNYTRRSRRNITSDLSNLATAVAEQNLEKYGYSNGDYFNGASGYQYTLADLDTFYGGYNSNAVVSTHHITIAVNTGANSQWYTSNDTSHGYKDSTLHTFLSGTVLNNIKSDFKTLFGGSTGLEHLIAHKLRWTTAISNAAWSDNAEYISALSEAQVYGTNVWSIDGYQTGEAWKHLTVFQKFSFNQIFGNLSLWLRNISSASLACTATANGIANSYGASDSLGAVGLIIFH